MMNKRFLSKNVIWALGFVLVLASCTPTMPDYFEQSASERVENEVVEFRELITEPTNGWIIEYYPGGTNRIHGGYALTAKFSDDGRVAFQSVLSNDVSTSVSSLYSVNKDIGTTLNFDTYNSLFHYFSSPDDGAVGSGVGEGMLGDYEFIYESGDNREIVLKGKKYNTIMHMYPLPDYQTATEYLTVAKRYMNSYSRIPAVWGLEGVFEGDSVRALPLSSSNQSFELVMDSTSTYFSFMFTNVGVKLYSPITLNDKTVDDLYWDPVARTFSSIDGNTVLGLVTNPLGLALDEILGDYYFTAAVNYGTSYVNMRFEVKLEETPEGYVKMTGLPFDLYFTYNFRYGALELGPQVVLSNPQVYAAMWNTTSGNLSWGADRGFIVSWNGDNDEFVLNFYDNGNQWIVNGQRIYVNAMILWQPTGGEYTGFGISRFMNMILTKRQ